MDPTQIIMDTQMMACGALVFSAAAMCASAVALVLSIIAVARRV